MAPLQIFELIAVGDLQGRSRIEIVIEGAQAWTRIT
jgi:hypothetical protein